ncbi:MAG TPA: hypothetical protein VG147_02570 [Solirubrobacteraceae bacterium]|jgi:hypothetical protein|nr:hypothetical protein [Solirubrobacteraceae bacterium]
MSREPEDIHAALAALADGTLPEPGRESVLARVAESPELAAELEDQRRAVMLARSLERVEAPTLLRRSIELAATGDAAIRDATAGEGSTSAGFGRSAQPKRERGSRRSPSFLRRPPRLAAGVAFAAAVAVVLVLVLATGGGTSAPTVLQASSSGLGTATGAAPAESPHNPHLLAASAAGIGYPYWGGKLGWRAVGARTDTVGGRTVTTVFYTDSRARRIGYSIVSGAALAIPAGSASVQRHGVSFHVLRHANPTIVTWREAGHTCILTARGVSAGTLMRLATWQRA